MRIYVTRKIPEKGITMLTEAGHDVTISKKDGVLTKEELIAALQGVPYEAVLCLLTDTVDADVFDAAGSARIFANYAVGYNNIDVQEAKKREIVVTNTPGVLTETVAEHTVALILAITSRIAEADRFMRAGKYVGWAPMLMLGTDLKNKTLGVLGAGRIGSRVAYHMSRGFDMNIIYSDIQRDEQFEQEHNAVYQESVEDVLRQADVVTIHVPLLDSTRHLINEERLALMKPGAYLVNSSRGPVIDEKALVATLQKGAIKGAALDVFEDEPLLAPGLALLENIVITPHIASATEETRSRMSEMAAENIIAILQGKVPPNAVS
jgi:glyoxylate reductase